MTDPIDEYLFSDSKDEFMRVHDYIRDELRVVFSEDETIQIEAVLTWADGTRMTGKEREYGEAVLDSFENYQDIIRVEGDEIKKGPAYTKIV